MKEDGENEWRIPKSQNPRIWEFTLSVRSVSQQGNREQPASEHIMIVQLIVCLWVLDRAQSFAGQRWPARFPIGRAATAKGMTVGFNRKGYDCNRMTGGECSSTLLGVASLGGVELGKQRDQSLGDQFLTQSFEHLPPPATDGVAEVSQQCAVPSASHCVLHSAINQDNGIFSDESAFDDNWLFKPTYFDARTVGRQVDKMVRRHVFLICTCSEYGIRTTKVLLKFLRNPARTVAKGKCNALAAKNWASASDLYRSVIFQRSQDIETRYPNISKHISVLKKLVFAHPNMRSYEEMVNYFGPDGPEPDGKVHTALKVCQPIYMIEDDWTKEVEF